MNFCKCGSITKDGKCTNDHCHENDNNNKRKDWVAGGMSMNFKRPVTYVEASELAEKLKNAEHRQN
jgi:hypothetical protein